MLDRSAYATVICVLAALALAGCVSASHPRAIARVPSPPAAVLIAPRFYRHANELSVYRVSQTTACLVTNPQQMHKFGGFAQVKVVPSSVDFLARQRGRFANVLLRDGRSDYSSTCWRT